MYTLPLWVLPNSKPGFYDTESATAIEQTAKLYRAMQDLIEEYNSFATRVNEEIEKFMSGTEKDYDVFKVALRQEFQDFIDVIELKYKNQDQIINDAVTKIDTNNNVLKTYLNAQIEEQNRIINDAVNYMKTNIMDAIADVLKDMRDSGELTDAVYEAFDNVSLKVTELAEYVDKQLLQINNNFTENINSLRDEFSESMNNSHREIMEYVKSNSCITFNTIDEMINDESILKDSNIITLGNGVQESYCLFTIREQKKDDLSIQLKNGLFANIVGETIDLTSLSKNPFSLLSLAVASEYRHIIISGDHTIDETVIIDNLYTKTTIEITGKITLNTTAFTITQSGNLKFTGGIYYGNDNILFEIPQYEDSDRASVNIECMYLDNCQLFKLANTSGYMRIRNVTIKETTKIPFEIFGEGLNIPPNFLYMSNCSMSGEFKIYNAVDLFFDNCDFVNTSGDVENSSQIVFSSCNFISRGRTNIFDNAKNMCFVGCIFEVASTETLLKFKNNCRGLSMQGLAIATAGYGLLADTSEMSGYIKLDLKPTYISSGLSNFILIGDNVSVDTFFPTRQAVLGPTGRVQYSYYEMNCKPNVVYTIPYTPARYVDGYVYLDEGIEGTSYIIKCDHT